MKSTKLSPPWYGYVNEIKALFEKDPDIKISFDEDNVELKLYVEGTDKYEALTKIIPEEMNFGGTVLKIAIVPANVSEGGASLFKAAFKGNPSVSQMEEVTGVFTNPVLYIAFKKEVIQYYDDNLGDINGNKSSLLEEIARDVFKEKDSGVLFCTDVV